MDVLFAGDGNWPSIDFDCGDFGNYGADSEAAQYLQTMRKLGVMRNCKTNRILRPSKFCQRSNIARKKR